MKLLVVILNYKTTSLTVDCLQSLDSEIGNRGDAAVVVVENGSGDGAEQQLRETITARGWGRWAELIPLARNMGFTAGTNLAIRRAVESPDPPQYILLLNSDAVAFPGAVDALVRFMDEHPQAGVAGSRLEYPSGVPQGSPFRFQGIVSELDRGLAVGIFSRMMARWTVYNPKPASAVPVDWVAGASMMLRREMIAEVGLLDERFFAYFEDMDLCLAGARMGWQTWYVPQSRIIHIEGASSGITCEQDESPPAYWFEARRQYFLKNHGVLYTLLVDSALILGCALGLFYEILRHRQVAKSWMKLKDSVRGSAFTGSRKQ